MKVTLTIEEFEALARIAIDKLCERFERCDSDQASIEKSVRNYIDHEIARLIGKSASQAQDKTQAPPTDDLKGLAAREAFLW